MTLPAKTRLFIESLKRTSPTRAIFIGEDGDIRARWNGLILYSVFQPIVKASSTDTIYGYEAFIRAIDSSNNRISPEQLFSKATDQDSITGLDRLCRTIHLLNFILNVDGHELLFLNINEGFINAVDDNHGVAFRKVVDSLGFSPNRIVIELPANLVKDSRRLHFVLQNYRLNSLEVAVNLDSTEDLKNVTESTPVHYIKINHSLILDADFKQKIQAVLIENKEVNIVVTKNDLPITGIDSNRYFFQGYAYGRPEALTTVISKDPSVELSIDEAFLQVGG